MIVNSENIDARELELYATNVEAWIAPVIKTLGKKYKAGSFDFGRAVDYVDRYCLVPAAKQYHREHGSMSSRWSDLFTKPIRQVAAENIIRQQLDEFKAGNFWS